MEIKKVKKEKEVKEKQNTYQYIMRHLDIYGEPLQWYIGNDKTYNTVVGGCRTFFVIGAALIFLGYSIYQLFTSREGSYVFYDIVFSEISDENVYYYKDFEIFFFFQTSGRQMMEMDTDILQAVIKQTKASDDSSSSTDSSDITRLRNLNKKRKLQPNSGDSNSNTPTNSDNTGTNTENQGTNTENQGTNTENQGTNTENQGTNTENQGSTTENQGSTTENQGSNTENQGSTTQNQGSTTENQGTNTENQGSNGENQGTNTENQENNQNLNEPTNQNVNGGGEINTQGSSSEDDVIAKYSFHECDNNYFSEQLGFSNTIQEGLSATYCLNYSDLIDEELNFTLSPLNPLGISSNPLIFTFEQNCKDSVCTNQENERYKRIMKQIKTLKIFIKSRITNPLDMENPLQSQVNTFTLTQSHLGSTLYFKKNLIKTDSSLIPYLVGAKKLEFLSFDYEKENTNSDATTFYLNFALSNTKGYLIRNYEKLDSSLANFLAVFNALEIIGKILTFFFASFSNEIFIFNYILKDRLLKKNNFLKSGKNPPKKLKFNSNDNFITNNDLKTNEENSNEEKNNLNLNKKNSLLLLNKNSKFKNNNNNNNNNLLKKENESVFSNQNLRQNSNTSSLNEMNLNEKNKLTDNNNFNNNNFISNTNIKIKSSETSENLVTNTKIYEKKKITFEEDDDFEEKKIELNFFKNFWSVVLMSFDKEKSRFNDVEDSIKKIKLIQNIFDSSVYINMFFDIMRIKKIIFNEKQEKLFNSIHFSLNEINDYIKIYQNNQEFLTKEEIIKTKISLSNEKQNKLTTNIFNILNEQMNFKSK